MSDDISDANSTMNVYKKKKKIQIDSENLYIKKELDV